MTHEDHTENGADETNPASVIPETSEAPPHLRDQTQALGETLKHIADRDPAGTPSDQAIAVFHEWLAAAGAASERPELFVDVAQNFDAQANTNRDIFLLFDMMVNHTEIEEEPVQLATFIGLPLLGS